MELIEIAKTLNELNIAFNKLNDKIFGNCLVQPIILIQTNGRRTNVLGWCTVKRIWKKKDKTEERYEITICAEYLTRPINELMSTMIHEMVHLYNLMNDVKDVSNGNIYHNKKFKEEAENRGLIVEHAPTIGWSVTTLSDELIELIKSLNIDESVFDWARELPIKEIKGTGKGKRKKNIIQYQCPSCETIIKAKKELHAMCKDCEVLFEVMDEDDDDTNDD
jgi:hypothetical protein